LIKVFQMFILCNTIFSNFHNELPVFFNFIFA